MRESESIRLAPPLWSWSSPASTSPQTARALTSTWPTTSLRQIWPRSRSRAKPRRCGAILQRTFDVFRRGSVFCLDCGSCCCVSCALKSVLWYNRELQFFILQVVCVQTLREKFLFKQGSFVDGTRRGSFSNYWHTSHMFFSHLRLEKRTDPWILSWGTPSSSGRRLSGACWTLRGRLELYVHHDDQVHGYNVLFVLFSALLKENVSRFRWKLVMMV